MAKILCGASLIHGWKVQVINLSTWSYKCHVHTWAIGSSQLFCSLSLLLLTIFLLNYWATLVKWISTFHVGTHCWFHYKIIISSSSCRLLREGEPFDRLCSHAGYTCSWNNIPWMSSAFLTTWLGICWFLWFKHLHYMDKKWYYVGWIDVFNKWQDLMNLCFHIFCLYRILS